MDPITQTYFPIKHGKPAFAASLDTVRHHRFTGPLWQQGIISKDKEADSGSKEFISVNPIADFISKEVMESKSILFIYTVTSQCGRIS